MSTFQNNNDASDTVAVTVTAEVDETPFLALVVETGSGRGLADLYLTDLAEAEYFLREVTEAVGQMRALVATAKRQGRADA